MKARPPSPAATLHTLYNRAARAFLLRQIPLVHSLLESAFALLHAPEPEDDLGPYRSKWDLLRITLETTVYASPPADLPDALRELLTQTPVALIIAAYRRSLALFTPRGAPQKASHIPSAIILTLVYSSLKLEAPDAGRAIVEDWLATRDSSDDANYRKTVEAYCLYVLPKLEQWEYASEFLDYESELSPDTRESFKTSLQSLHAQAVASRLPRVPPSPTVPPPRPYSPTPSSSSSSSSLSSTASMHTVVPATPRARSNIKPSNPRTVSSTSSASTATPRLTRSSLPNGPTSSSPSPPRTRPSTHPHPSPAHLPRLHPTRIPAPAPPSTYTLLHAALAPYLSSKTKLAAAALSIVTFVLLLLVRHRRRANNVLTPGAATPSKFGGGGGDVAHAELVRKRLAAAADGGGTGVLARAVGAVLRVVGDTVRMGGSGLV
ncbi:hypothetical protein DFH08DRAFT_913575 [Mycena albidolilacea]|uniref:Uncharacterized protein n=1 Tax=Mycena albidolilacea TaxID=1033008 RepID=A0AAD7ETB2_9AGAR|nr:hypothetical protein DFH08DRAFT_913575 [Mycena albidolilacea]